MVNSVLYLLSADCPACHPYPAFSNKKPRVGAIGAYVTPSDVFTSLLIFSGSFGEVQMKLKRSIFRTFQKALLLSPVPQVCGDSLKSRIKRHVVLRMTLIKLQLTFVCIIDRAAMLGGWLVISPMCPTVSVSVSTVGWLQYKV